MNVSYPGRIALLTGALASALLAADFRPPAVPLVTHDPYFSIWSMADHLTDGPTKHWTGVTQSLSSLVRIDGKTYRVMGAQPREVAPLKQLSVNVLPTHTNYSFEGAGIHLDLVFFTPALPYDLEILSRPATYITWKAHSTDSGTHEVEIYFDAGAELAVNTREESVTWARYQVGKLQILRAGSMQQPVLEKSGDDLRIDWGYLYLTGPVEEGGASAVTVRSEATKHFLTDGAVPTSDDLETFQPYGQSNPVLAESFSLGHVGSAPVSKYVVIAYDDQFSIEYLQRRLRPYWRRNGVTVTDMLQAALREYPSLEERCARFDEVLMKDLQNVGGERYARLCSLAYRQTLAAHKLVADLEGTPLFFSKENFSNGSIDTVDVTYPSAPFFLLFDTRLLEAQLKPILDYASLSRWHFPFAPHDLGRYPLANGQQYGGGERTEENQMPVEESGNMLLMIAAMEQVNGNARFAQQYWPLLTKWAEYLKKEGLDPENQLCTDDFAGHLAHNANLSLKAILALGAYSNLAGSLGHNDAKQEYGELARGYAARWAHMDKDGDHYRLAFDRPGTWSQKYNLVWDKLLHLNLFSPDIAKEELAFYERHTNKFGVPLDNRADYTKIDWLTWTATLAPNKQEFEQIFDPAYAFANESPSRVPLTDWYNTVTGKQESFQARSVVGGMFIRMLADDSVSKEYAEMNRER